MTQVIQGTSQCPAKAMFVGVWLQCQRDAHNPNVPHENAGMNHCLVWDNSGYYENRIF